MPGCARRARGRLRNWSRRIAQSYQAAVADEFIARERLSRRIATSPGDFFSDPLPPADLHFYGMIFDDWPAERCRALAVRSLASLPSGGRIIVHEVLFNDDFTGPFSAAAFNINMLTLMTGAKYSGREMTQFLSDAGFTQIEVKPAFGYFSIVTGVKP